MIRSAAALVATGALMLAGCAPEHTRNAVPATSVSAAPASNGIAALEATEILRRASTQVKAAKSYHVAGNVTESGLTLQFDMKIAGKDKAGMVTVGSGKMELLAVGGNQYVRLDRAFWISMLGAKQGKQVAAAIAGRWTKAAKENKALTKWFDAVDIDTMLDGIAGSGTLTKGTLTEFDGTPAIIVTDQSSGESFCVATTGQPYLLKAGDIGGSKIVFSDFDKDFPEIGVPPASEVVEAPANTKKA